MANHVPWLDKGLRLKVGVEQTKGGDSDVGAEIRPAYASLYAWRGTDGETNNLGDRLHEDTLRPAERTCSYVASVARIIWS